MNDDEEFDEEWDDENFEMHYPKMGPIHKAFYPFDSEKPFEECTMCKLKFTESSEYLVEKAIKGTDVIFEIAMCISCATKMKNQMSTDSIERIEKFMATSVNMEDRAKHFIEQPSDQIQDYIGKCLVSGVPIDRNEEHQIYALCHGKEMIYSALPYAMSGEVLEKIQDLLSPETRQEMDDFMDQYLIPDDLRDLLKGRPVLV